MGDGAASPAGDGVPVIDVAAFLADLSVAQLVCVQEAAEEQLQSATLTAQTPDALLDLLEARERVVRKALTFNAALHVEISDRSVYRKAGFTSLSSLYTHGLHVGYAEARRRSVVALGVGRLSAMSGQTLAPQLPATAEFVAEGQVGADNVEAIAKVMDKIPSRVPADERARAEQILARAACTLSPEDVTTVGNRLLATLDPDGTLEDDADRARRRSFALQPQDRQLMSKIRARLTPLARARMEVMLTQWAAVGMNNPEDPQSPRGAADQPGLDPAVLAAAAERDTRTLGQRQHDALAALMEWERAQTGVAPNGSLASELVITVSDTDLARQAGVALTATGTRLSVTDLVNLAGDVVPWMEVFAGATSQVLYLGRGRRLASRAQRLAVFGRDRGCTTVGCSVPFARTQVHHMPDWAEGGCTDIDHIGGACGKHNRWNGKNPGQWESTVLTSGNDVGRVGWRPVGRPGSYLVNPIFHPEKLADHHPNGGLHVRMGEVSDTDPPATG